MVSSLHKVAVSALSGLLAVVLVLGACIACARPVVTESAAAHPCCDPKGSCKPSPAQMDHTQCEASQALLPDVVTPQPGSDAQFLPAVFDAPFAASIVTVAVIVDTSPPLISPLLKSSLLRI